MSTPDDKLEARKQWDRDPCGAVTAAPLPPESAEWYESVRRHRFEQYAPWMPAVVPFGSWRNRDVLEIGVGLGSDHLSFAQAGARMYCLDLSSEHLRHTQQHLAFHGLVTQARLGDAEHNPWPDSSMDLVYSFGVLHHTPGTEQAIAELRRVLRPGGTAVVGLYHRDSWFFWLRTILFRGVLRLGLLRGYRRLISEIEFRSGANDAIPLVKVYSRGAARRLFAAFCDIEIAVHHVAARDFPPPLWWALRFVPRALLERYLRFAGWYVMIRATKPLA